ncbi:unnamed protein product [Effrenium voratum]|uniref:F-box domain-containing protein n=1 Tax=Effrenium voratum TaxID=2562239 RepID=A0AA36J0I7_9DINO|nr:unnamed protein product [Effrenium voratum]
MCVSFIVDFFQKVLQVSCNRIRGPPEIADQGQDEKDMPSRRRTDTSTTAGSISSAPSGLLPKPGPSLTELNDEVLLHILSLLPGWMAWRVEQTGHAWRRALHSGNAYWQSRCLHEFAARLGPSDLARRKYRQLLGVREVRRGVWCYCSRRHGLGDRVAAPQLFVGPRGQKLFSYGGWTDRGPQTDLHSVPVHAVSESSMREEPWRFQRAEESGMTATRGGVQTLTPLWFGEEGPSETHISETAQSLRRLTAARELHPGGALVLAFGGGGGGYRHEHNSWAVGYLHEGEGQENAQILWGKPQACKDLVGEAPQPYQPVERCAHSATYVPARFTMCPEGCVVVFGGHTGHCATSLASFDVLSLHDWSWSHAAAAECTALQAQDWEMPPRHGHSTTLFEVDGKGYLVVVGGGRGNILENWNVRDFADIAVLCLESWTWIGHYQLQSSGNLTPGRHHTACRALGQLLLVGGGRRPSRQVCVLDAEQVIRRALRGDVQGLVPLRTVPDRLEDDGADLPVPVARKMHGAACLAPYAPLLVIFGGWETGPHFSDLWTFALGADTEDLKDFRAAEAEEEREEPGQESLVGVRMMGPDGQVRVMRVPSELLAQFLRQGVVRRADDLGED